MRAIFCLAVSVCLALLGSLAAHGAQWQHAEARMHVEYFRHAHKALALVRLELPAGSYAYAHEPGAPVKPAVLALRDELGWPVRVLYPAGKEIRSPGLSAPTAAGAWSGNANL